MVMSSQAPVGLYGLILIVSAVICILNARELFGIPRIAYVILMILAAPALIIAAQIHEGPDALIALIFAGCMPIPAAYIYDRNKRVKPPET
jgi:cytochrome c oxidase subunit IV